MFRNTALAGTSTFKLILGFGLCTLGGAMLYAYFKTRDDEEEDVPQKANGSARQRKPQLKQEKDVTVDLVVPNERIPLIVGRSGANLTSIEAKTRTKIKLRDKDDKSKYCDITGPADAVKDARALLLKEIERAPLVREEILVAQSVCGQITGRCGEAMKEICRTSMAKVSIDPDGRGGSMDHRRVIVTGTRQQVNIALKLIEDKIEEDEELRHVAEEIEQKREPRRSPTNSTCSSMYSSQTSLPPPEKIIAARCDEKPTEVYVSAVASPSRFWVQIIGPRAKQLDDLVNDMTDYYSDIENRNRHKLSKPSLGQIVAAAFKYDGKWYRAEIVAILPNKYKENEEVYDLYFLDYGDSEYVTVQDVFELRTDFLTLRFQAVECFMANIKSTNGGNPNDWDSPAIKQFEDITRVAQWKKLTLRLVTCKERPKAIKSGSTSTSEREGSPILGVELFEFVEGVEVSIGSMLIRQGLALPIEDKRAHSRSPECITPEMQLEHNSSTPEPPRSPEAANNKTLTNNSEDSAEDALLEQQLQHLRKNNHFNGNTLAQNPAKMNAEFMNGGFNTSAAAVVLTTNGKHSLNENLSR